MVFDCGVAANVPAGEYVVVPSTFDKGVERSFTIEVILNLLLLYSIVLIFVEY